MTNEIRWPAGQGAFSMILEPVIAVLNGLERDGYIGRYAIAGAIGVILYTEPFITYDLDVMAVLPTTDSGLVDLSRLYRHLVVDLGCRADGEHVVIADVPVQFLAAYDKLTIDAFENAVDVPLGNQTSRVLSYEHLLAIMLNTGRPKDLLKLHTALESRAPDATRLNAILVRHGLVDAWARVTGTLP